MLVCLAAMIGAIAALVGLATAMGRLAERLPAFVTKMAFSLALIACLVPVFFAFEALPGHREPGAIAESTQSTVITVFVFAYTVTAGWLALRLKARLGWQIDSDDR